jgi:TM2 domain-containing membrane protein YozV
MEDASTKQPGEKYCHSCGKLMKEAEISCPHCGAKNPLVQTAMPSNECQSRKITAGLLAILVGGFGVHKFYLGDSNMGILYLCFFWTGVPAIIGIVEGIIYLTMSDDEFCRKYIK